MTRYLLLINTPEPDVPPPDAEWQAMLAEYDRFGTWLGEQGWARGGDALQPSSTATTVSVRGGQRIVTDGPFAETKEQLGGYFLVDVPSIDDAVEAASRIPGAALGHIEVRALIEFE